MRNLTLERLQREILKAETRPSITALSMAVGVAVAFSPFLGLHFVIAFTSIKLLRLNHYIVIPAVLIHNPWTMIPIHFTQLLLGDLILSGKLSSLEVFHNFPWKDLSLFSGFRPSFWQANGQAFHDLLWPFLMGSILLSAIFGGISYYLTLRFLRRSSQAPAADDATR